MTNTIDRKQETYHFVDVKKRIEAHVKIAELQELSSFGQ